MSFHTTLVDSRILFVLIAISILSACAKTPKPPEQAQFTQLQIREMQTREYDSVSQKDVMKSVISALMDEGFIINATDNELGLITAAKETYALDESTKSIAEFNYGAGSGTYQTTLRSEASSIVNKHGDVIRVRITIVQKAVSNAGGNIWSQPLLDAQVYQGIFSKVDKSVFLEKEKI